MIAPDVELFLRLAEANRERGDLSAAVAALSTALERGAADGDRAAVAAAAERLAAAASPADPASRSVAEAARELAARAKRPPGAAPVPPAPAPAPAPPAPAPPAAEAPRPATKRGKKRLVAPELVGSIRDVVGAPQAGGDVLLPVVEVVAQLLSADAEVRTTADLALGLVARATGADKAHLVLADAARTAFGLPGGPPRPATTSQGILDEVARTRATVTVGDARRDPRFADRPSIQELQVRSVVAAPVLAEGGEVLVGALYLEGSAGRFGERERGVVEALAGLVGPPLWTARRREEAERGREKAERLLAREREEREGPVVLGKSPAIVELRRLIDRVAPGEHTVLIEGESGTGKELVARAIHARSGRADGPFVAENVGALAAGLAEAELFGHERGAFTGAEQRRQGLFELAEGGTLLLDEIGEAPLDLQAKLLRVLQEREVRPLGGTSSRRVDVRVLAATNRDLAAEVRAGRFREDLYYRLTTIRLRVPPLRERAGDVPLLLEALLAREAAQARRPPPLVPQELQRRLEQHPWPGNVRELQAFAARYLLVGAHDPASTSGAPDAAPAAAPADERGLAISLRMGETPPELREARSAFDKAYLAAVLAKYGGNVTAAAKALNMNRSHLSVLVGRYDLR